MSGIQKNLPLHDCLCFRNVLWEEGRTGRSRYPLRRQWRSAARDIVICAKTVVWQTSVDVAPALPSGELLSLPITCKIMAYRRCCCSTEFLLSPPHFLSSGMFSLLVSCLHCKDLCKFPIPGQIIHALYLSDSRTTQRQKRVLKVKKENIVTLSNSFSEVSVLRRRQCVLDKLRKEVNLT